MLYMDGIIEQNKLIAFKTVNNTWNSCTSMYCLWCQGIYKEMYWSRNDWLFN